MDDRQKARLSDAELKAFFDRLVPYGFAGTDVLAELAPEGWGEIAVAGVFSSVAPEQVFKERLQVHRNLERIAPDGRIVDIGAFRGASAFLDEWLSGRSGAVCGDEHRFYMGTIWISQRADLTPVYRLIFRRVKALGGIWQYQFPRLHLVDLSPLRKALAQKRHIPRRVG